MHFKLFNKNIIKNQVRYGYIKTVSFIVTLLKNGYQSMTLLGIQRIIKENLPAEKSCC